MRRPPWLPGRVLAGLVGMGAPMRPLIKRVLGLAGNLPPADLVMSAGGETIAANVVAACRLRAPSIFCGTLRRVAPERFSLVVSSYVRHAALPRHLVALKPNGIDPDQLTGNGRASHVAGHPPQTAGLLIGGDSGLFRYRLDEWQRLAQFVVASHATHGTRWVVSTSRRSPDAIAELIGALAAQRQGPIAEFIDYRTTGPGTLARLFGCVEAVLCTEDSSTMLSEAVCARLPVVGISPQVHAFKEEEREYRAFMCQQGWCRFLPLSGLGPERFLEALADVRPLTENHLDRLASQLAERLPELF